MAFKKTKQSNLSLESPEALFRDLRNRKVQGLLAHQADLLREYSHEEFLDAQDVALQLPTGSGKTLVGLLLGEWRRRKFGEKVLYLCPTRQLVHQVAEQSSTLYGIKTNAFTGSKQDFSQQAKSEYLNGETIAVATYSGLFNIAPFFEKPGLIILDDAHAAEGYIADYWSLEIERFNKNRKHGILFKTIVSALSDIISPQQYLRLEKEAPDFTDLGWVEKLPSPYFAAKLKHLTVILDEHISDIKELSFSWSVLRDKLHACNFYLSVNSILIRPVLPPTLTHLPFANAKQRVYMSATLGEGGELERITGIESIKRLSPPNGWEKQGNGRRLFFFPERSLDEEEALDLTIEMLKATSRALFLVPEERTAGHLKTLVTEKAAYQVFDAKELERSKQPFVELDRAAAIVANRYDGIDLKDDECRLLVIKGLPRALNLQEKFLISRMPASILFVDRMITRIVQAIGRCTRSATDYAAVVILGEDLNAFLLDNDQRLLLHPELQAELDFGISESRNVSRHTFLDNFRIFLEHQEDWQEAEDYILSQRDTLQQAPLPGLNQLKAATPHEIRYQYSLWRGDYEKAVDECRSVLTHLSGDLVKGYRAFWFYIAGSAAWLGSESGISSLEAVARDFFKKAFLAAEGAGIPWLLELSRLSESSQEEDFVGAERLAAVIEGLESHLISLGTTNNRKFEKEIKFILENLDKTDPKESYLFEEAHKRLGSLLGYSAGNVESTAAPDPWWIGGDDFCIVFEDHSSEGDIETAVIGANKVRQAESHEKWIRSKKLVRKDAEIFQVLISPVVKIEENAALYAENVFYWNRNDFLVWAKQAIAVIRELRNSFPGEANLEWRKKAEKIYKENKLSPNSLASLVKQRRLKDLPQN
ncbi:DEAD/DEAH box helicase [Leptolyngbya sp. PL-A3]|uniref:DEAD/DEAH box helicase n=1 Tax=Leptolyngbya sp. PL-A3 TaxID=2933911 RepID=UPI0032967CA2